MGYIRQHRITIYTSISFAEDGSRIKYKKVCASCGKEVSAKDIVKGFEYDKDKFVIMTDEDFEKAKSEKDKTIHILHFYRLKFNTTDLL